MKPYSVFDQQWGSETGLVGRGITIVPGERRWMKLLQGTTLHFYKCKVLVKASSTDFWRWMNFILLEVCRELGKDCMLKCRRDTGHR